MKLPGFLGKLLGQKPEQMGTVQPVSPEANASLPGAAVEAPVMPAMPEAPAVPAAPETGMPVQPLTPEAPASPASAEVKG